MIKTKTHILKASGKLQPFIGIIRQSVDEVLDEISGKLTLPQIDIVVADNPKDTISEIGICGNVYTPHFVLINIDPEFSQINNILSKEIKSTLAHELHHCVRIQGVGYGETLFEAMVSEGLADHFDSEITGAKPRPWSIALDNKQANGLMKLAEKEFFASDYNHNDWFFGSEKRQIPKWTAYTLGFNIVRDYIGKTGETASSLVNTKAERFYIT